MPPVALLPAFPCCLPPAPFLPLLRPLPLPSAPAHLLLLPLVPNRKPLFPLSCHQNIVFDETGYAKLVDMGLAKRIPRGHKAWTVCGTPAYQAPEVHAGLGCSLLVDVWCMGVLAYELLTGQNPFGAVDAPDQWWKTVQKIDSGR